MLGNYQSESKPSFSSLAYYQLQAAIAVEAERRYIEDRDGSGSNPWKLNRQLKNIWWSKTENVNDSQKIFFHKYFPSNFLSRFLTIFFVRVWQNSKTYMADPTDLQQIYGRSCQTRVWRQSFNMLILHRSATDRTKIFAREWALENYAKCW
jgi:hypothetical protein